MKDACGRTIKVGDKLIYGGMGGVKAANAGEVLSITKGLKVRVFSATEYGTLPGKEVTLGGGNRDRLPLHHVIVFESGGEPVDFSKRLIKRCQG